MDDSGCTSAMQRARFGNREFDVSWRKAKPGLAGDRDALAANLHQLVEIARAADTELLLMNYPDRGKFYALANPTIRQVAQETGALFLDLTPRLFHLVTFYLLLGYSFLLDGRRTQYARGVRDKLLKCRNVG